ncbi:hypothetical protein pdam_00025094, partial [Pocillopora damicornis]
ENEQPEIVEPFSFEEFSESGSGLSSYEKRHIANIQKWDNIRRQLFDSYVEECCFLTDTTCVYCLQEPATLRCQYCGPKQYFCLECANILHIIKEYMNKEGMFTPYVVNGLPLGFQCNCGSAEARDIVCIDEHVWFCNCYHPTTTLIKNNLWPASPDKPATAFTFYLMDLMETVFLHCKVSLREFCEAVELLRPSLQPRMVFSIYQLLNQASFEEYRTAAHFMLVNLQAPLDQKERINFLMRKESLVVSADMTSPKDFIASNMVKGAFQIGYPLYEVKRFLDENNKSLKFVMLYDIACILSSHMKKNAQELLFNPTQLTLGIPIFHCYGHKASCQIKYSPRRIDGIGLTDGEGTERLWAFLRDYSRITKEMAADKRIDVLTDGLLHYGDQLREKFGKACLIYKGSFLRVSCTTALMKLIHCPYYTTEPVTEQDIEMWIEAEVSTESSDEELEWDEKYVESLSTANDLKFKLQSNSEINAQEVESIKKQLQRLEKLQTSIERQQGIQRKWTVASSLYKEVLARLKLKQGCQLLKKLHHLAAERIFVLEMKKKYADGQAIAKKLNKELTKITASVKLLIPQLKALRTAQFGDLSDDEVFVIVKDPQSTIYSAVNVDPQRNTLAHSTKIQIINVFLLKKRANEEIILLKAEVERFQTFLSEEVQKVDSWIDKASTQNNPSHKNLLLVKRASLIQELASLQRLWKEEVLFETDYEELLKRILDGSGESTLSLLEDEAANDNDDVDDVSSVRDETEADENEQTDNLDQ